MVLSFREGFKLLSIGFYSVPTGLVLGFMQGDAVLVAILVTKHKPVMVTTVLQTYVRNAEFFTKPLQVPNYFRGLSRCWIETGVVMDVPVAVVHVY